MDKIDLALCGLLVATICLAGGAFLFPEAFDGLTFTGAASVQRLTAAVAHAFHFGFDKLRPIIGVLFG